MHPEDREPTAYHRTKLLEGTALINFENRYVSKNGKVIWLHWTSTYIPDKEVVFAIAKDVTQKKIEKEIEENYKKFKRLATHLLSGKGFNLWQRWRINYNIKNPHRKICFGNI